MRSVRNGFVLDVVVTDQRRRPRQRAQDSHGRNLDNGNRVPTAMLGDSLLHPHLLPSDRAIGSEHQG